MAHVYKQLTGEMFRNDVLEFKGYAGHGEGLNNPDKDDVKSVGPLPEGAYTMGVMFDHPQLGKRVIPLFPDKANAMHGRGSFYIHGDEKNHPGEFIASDGCIVSSLEERVAAYNTGDSQILVVSGKV